MNIATLGPAGTHSTQAAAVYEPAAELNLCGTISEVVSAVDSGQSDAGVIPLENSIHGIVAETLDGLAQTGLLITEELVIDIHHVLCGTESKSVHKIYSHPQALSQCRQYIAGRYPEAELIAAPSTAAAIKSVADSRDKNVLAIGSEFAARHYGLPVVAGNIEDEKGNQTRFVAFSRQPAKQTLPFILAAALPQTDRPGLLHDILSIIKDQGVNMLQIDSRPIRTRLGSYIFYIRMQMVSNDPRFDNIVAEAKEIGVLIKRMTA